MPYGGSVGGRRHAFSFSALAIASLRFILLKMAGLGFRVLIIRVPFQTIIMLCA